MSACGSLGLQAIKEGEPDHAAQMADYLPKLKAYQDYEKQFDARQPAWEKSLAAVPVWEPMTVTKATAQSKAKLNFNAKDNIVLVNGPNPPKDVYTVTFTSKLSNITAIRLEVLPDASAVVHIGVTTNVGSSLASWLPNDGEVVSETTMRLDRAGSSVQIELLSEFDETPSGRPVRIHVRQGTSQSPVENEWVFPPRDAADTSVESIVRQAGGERRSREPWPEGEWLPPAAA